MSVELSKYVIIADQAGISYNGYIIDANDHVVNVIEIDDLKWLLSEGGDESLKVFNFCKLFVTMSSIFKICLYILFLLIAQLCSSSCELFDLGQLALKDNLALTFVITGLMLFELYIENMEIRYKTRLYLIRLVFFIKVPSTFHVLRLSIMRRMLVILNVSMIFFITNMRFREWDYILTATYSAIVICTVCETCCWKYGFKQWILSTTMDVTLLVIWAIEVSLISYRVTIMSIPSIKINVYIFVLLASAQIGLSIPWRMHCYWVNYKIWMNWKQLVDQTNVIEVISNKNNLTTYKNRLELLKMFG